MKIAHISDLHIRNFKYRDEYKVAFEDLYAKLRELKPDLVVNTGDTVHSKLAVSPELFDDVATHMLRISEIAPYWLTLGNHDLNLKNKGRTDAISPVVRAITGRTEHEVELLGPGMHIPPLRHTRFRFWNYDIRGHEPYSPPKTHINVGLYHGSVRGCVTDIGFTMDDEAEVETSKFDTMDFVMMGDIHKRQSFRNGRIWYPGSLIQQNYGEELVKGFLVWDIFDSDNAVVDFHEVRAPGRFYTIQVPASFDPKTILTGIPTGSRIKALVEGELTPSKRMQLEKDIRDVLNPLEVIIPDCTATSGETAAPDIDDLIGDRDKVIREHLLERGVPEGEIDAVVTLFHQYEAGLDSDSAARGTTWKIRRIAWDNMMNYGEGNVLDLTKLEGLVGIFAPNASGKSSIFDIMLQALFDKTSKEVPRNIDLVNDNKDIGLMSVELESSGTPFSIERSIERIHYGQRKFAETKQWGKTNLDFSSVDESLNGTSRPETEREIRKVIGSFEDFVLTTMVTQNPVFGIPGGADLLNCRETDRRKILFRFLDLDVYERIANAVKDDHKELMGKFKGLNREELQGKLDALRHDRSVVESKLAIERGQASILQQQYDEVARYLEKANAKSVDEMRLQLMAVEDEMRRAERQIESAREAVDDASVWIQSYRLKIRDHGENRPVTPAVPMEELHLTINRLRSEREGVLVGMSRNKIKRDQGVKSLSTLEGVPCEGKFPTCKFIREASAFLGERELVEQAITELTRQNVGYETEIAKYEDLYVVHKNVAEWEREQARLELELSQREHAKTAEEANLAVWTTNLVEIQARVTELRRRLAEVSADEIDLQKAEQSRLTRLLKDARRDADAQLKAIGALDSKIEGVRADVESLDGLQSRLLAHERLMAMCGKNGLPYRILAMVLPVINAEIAKILGGIVKFNVFFEDDPEEQTVSLYIRYGDYKSRPLAMGSGAERFIASIAIRVALLSVSSLPKTDILIIDEGFGRLDPEHLEALQKMFEYLREAFGTVFVVSHVDFMRDIVDHSVEIASQDGYAHVEVI